MNVMSATTQQRLIELNRAFYKQVAQDFDRTRGGLALGWQQLTRYFPTQCDSEAPWVLDVGCGNGRFARALEQSARSWRYVGIDADTALLAHAVAQASAHSHVTAHYQQVDLTEASWITPLGAFTPTFDLIVCFAVLHHLPGYALRRQVMQAMTGLLAKGSVLVLSNWQFLTSDRFAQKQIDWQSIGLTAQEVEPGDALLPWQQGGFAVRYVHQIDETEVGQLAHESGLVLIDMFYADGKEGNLNLYSVLQRKC
jgi:2-polyprenyl-3-methyl-5-hydroxy-6-metoxy-1,4-benzoquinol methylase